ncbi:hypothetical protein BASA81_002485 [Batrachochytrium salamandrivorans]|nr:hypothetical protein BASA81_002485 [Batrachochytrium salamandrivorans]
MLLRLVGGKQVGVVGRRRFTMGAPVATREQEKQLFKRESRGGGMEIEEFVMPPPPPFRPARIGLAWLFGLYFLISLTLRASGPPTLGREIKVQDDHLIPKEGRSMLFRERAGGGNVTS